MTKISYWYHQGRILWRKYGGFPILITQLLAYIFCSHIIYSGVVLLWMTIPCGIKEVNINPYLWYPRQLLFFSMALTAFLTGIK